MIWSIATPKGLIRFTGEDDKTFIASQLMSSGEEVFLGEVYLDVDGGVYHGQEDSMLTLPQMEQIVDFMKRKGKES